VVVIHVHDRHFDRVPTVLGTDDDHSAGEVVINPADNDHTAVEVTINRAGHHHTAVDVAIDLGRTRPGRTGAAPHRADPRHGQRTL
jgi:hypothetical protein